MTGEEEEEEQEVMKDLMEELRRWQVEAVQPVDKQEV